MNNDDTYMSEEAWDAIRRDRGMRMEMARRSLTYFAHIYFPEYFKYKTAPFQREMYTLLADNDIKHLGIVAFRGGGKSTIVTTIYPIWAVLGTLEKRYVLIASQTQSQAQQHLRNIKREYETNELLIKDFGPLQELSDEWATSSFVLTQFDARISAVSTEQSIRGTRHGAHRPDLVVADDVEDLNSVKTSASREKTYSWYTSEVLPIGDRDTKFVLVGNLLHSDSLMMRMKAYTGHINSPNFVFKEYPLINHKGECLWPGKYPDKAAIALERAAAASDPAWFREYLLQILPDDYQIVKPDDIHYYDQIPMRLSGGSYKTAIAVDLAISKRDTADFTGIVTMEKHGYGNDTKIYIHPNPINKRNLYSETVEDVCQLKQLLGAASIYIEDVGMQRSIIEMFDARNVHAEAVPINGKDKQERLQIAAYWIKNGTVQFPARGCEKLLQQITGFGVERDDLLDAFTLGVIHLMEQKNDGGSMRIGHTNLWGRGPNTPLRFW
jgi:phage terminase large subunit-like protein